MSQLERIVRYAIGILSVPGFIYLAHMLLKDYNDYWSRQYDIMRKVQERKKKKDEYL